MGRGNILTDKTSVFMKSYPSIKKSLLAGLISGIIGGFLATALLYPLQSATGLSFATNLNPFAIIFASIFANLAGCILLYIVAKHAERPIAIYIAIGLLFTIIDSIYAYLAMSVGFATIAIPLHIVVFLVAIIFVPKFMFGKAS